MIAPTLVQTKAFFFFAFVLGMFLSRVIDQSSPVGKEAFSVVFLYL